MRRQHPIQLSHHPTPDAHREMPVPCVALRTRAGVVLDVPVPWAARTWASTLWADERVPGGWARALWEPHPSGRGWVLPGLLALGDIVEFGAVGADVDQRWWGIVDSYQPDAWLTVIGPLATPAEALELARTLLAAERPPPLSLAVDHSPPRQRQRRRRCHH